MKRLALIVLTAIMLTLPLMADVPLGEEVTNDAGLTFVLMPYPLIPIIQLPGLLPPDLFTSGLLVSVRTDDPTLTQFFVSALVTTVSGNTFMLQGTVTAATNPGDYSSVALSYLGEDLIVSVQAIDVTAVGPDSITHRIVTHR